MPCMYALHAHHWSHGQVLPEVGDEVKMVNSRLVDGIKGVDALFTGEEGTSVEIVVEKCDNSGIFTCHLTRRPLI
jgi:C-terminal processing protease CtpA/Prc